MFIFVISTLSWVLRKDSHHRSDFKTPPYAILPLSPLQPTSRRGDSSKCQKYIEKSKGDETKALKSWVYPVGIVRENIWYIDTGKMVPHGAKCCLFTFGFWCLNHRRPPHATTRPTDLTKGPLKKAWPSFFLSTEQKSTLSKQALWRYVYIMYKELGDWLTITAH